MCWYILKLEIPVSIYNDTLRQTEKYLHKKNFSANDIFAKETEIQKKLAKGRERLLHFIPTRRVSTIC